MTPETAFIIYYAIGTTGFIEWVLHLCRNDRHADFRICGIMFSIVIWWVFWPLALVALAIAAADKGMRKP
jgi:hypothetical protein